MGKKKRRSDCEQAAPVETQDIQMQTEQQTDMTTGEVARLQQALDHMIQQTQKLQTENTAMEKQLTKLQDLKAEVQTLRSQNRLLKQEKQQAARKYQAVQYRLTRLEKKYADLSNSKLGRLTLNYWAWRKRRGTGKLRLSNFFLIRWLFNKLPPVQEAPQEPSDQVAVVKSKPENTPVAAVPAAPAAQTAVPQVETQSVAVMTPEQENWAQPYMERAAQMPDSNGCRYYQKLALRVGIVCDEFFYDSIQAAAEFVYLTPDNWQEELEQGLDALLLVSAWRGLNMEWQGMASLNAALTGIETPARQAGRDLIRACKGRGIPTVFYSKEDPPNYERFLAFAKECDFVFTSAKECAPYYNEDCGRQDVQAVCFGINPVEHNPIGSVRDDKDKAVLFSGSWMVKYPDRCRELADIFDGILQSDHGLHIIDRNYPDNKRYAFPEAYFPYTSPAVSHTVLQKLHKQFDWAVNINSVKGSETMFANRAFELQANGVLLLSNFSVGVNDLLPTVQMVQESSEVADILGGFTPEERYAKQMAGVRSVMTGHTCFDRLTQLLTPTGLAAAQPTRNVLVLAEHLTKRVQASFDCQTYPDKTLMRVSDLTEATLEQYDMVTWFADGADYGVFYLEDMANGFKYTACDYITKDAWYEAGVLHKGIEHDYVTRMGSKYRTLFWREAFTGQELLNMSDGRELPNGYSIDHFNYDAAPVARVEEQVDYRLSVVIPVYNNGRHLYGKCFASLRRSSIFRDMEIIMVDDGSTDPYTLRVEEYLQHQYPNIRLYRFGDGGSGSASRPRNRGVTMATAPYLTFLDPDNEAVCDGYARLLELAKQEDRELVLGNMYKITTKTQLANYYGTLRKTAGTDRFDNGVGNLLADSNFYSASIQAMVMRTSLIRDNALEQVPGAAGQDTLFSWQLLSCAKRIALLDIPIHIYYAQTAGSVTNTVSRKFFQKLLLLQKPKADWLKEIGQMDAFMKGRYDYYTTNLVFAKLAQATDSAECAKLVEEMLDIFAPYYRNTDPLINRFTQLCKAGDYAGAAELTRETFRKKAVRPMPTLEELADSAREASKVQVTYRQEGSTITFTNRSGGESEAFAWVILKATGRYAKLYSTKYTKTREFTYDFAGLDADAYKVRAFLRDKDTKISDDVALIRVSAEKQVTLVGAASKVVKE